MSMENWNKWVARDIITTVLLSLLLIVIQLVINMVAMLNDFVSMVLSVGISCFLCAPIYFLFGRCIFDHGRLVFAAVLCSGGIDL